MPKAILEFNLPEDQFDFDLAVHASDYRRLLYDLDNVLRADIKYGDGKSKPALTAQDIRDALYKLLEEYDIKLH